MDRSAPLPFGGFYITDETGISVGWHRLYIYTWRSPNGQTIKLWLRRRMLIVYRIGWKWSFRWMRV